MDYDEQDEADARADVSLMIAAMVYLALVAIAASVAVRLVVGP